MLFDNTEDNFHGNLELLLNIGLPGSIGLPDLDPTPSNEFPSKELSLVLSFELLPKPNLFEVGTGDCVEVAYIRFWSAVNVEWFEDEYFSTSDESFEILSFNNRRMPENRNKIITVFGLHHFKK